MEISVIIPTYNGANKISFLLDALLLQTFSDFQLIVVIDGSTDDTLKKVEIYKEKFDNLVIIEQENRGRAAVRNRGASEASGDLLVFYDDDMIPATDSVARHREFHISVKKRCILGGNQVEYQDFKKTDIQNYKAWLSKKWTAKFTEGINEINLGNIFLTAANFSVSKRLFGELGGFYEQLNDIEDLEFAKRALSKNVKIYFDKSNRAIHHDPITCLSYINRVRQYHVVQQHLHFLFPDKFPDKEVKQSGKRLFYRLFAFSFWSYLIDRTAILKILPIKLRYKIYEWVIYSLGVAFSDVPLRNRTN